MTTQLPDGRTFGVGITGTKHFCRQPLEERTGRQATFKFSMPTGDGIPPCRVAIRLHEGAAVIDVIGKYIGNVLVVLDRFGNTILDGDSDETLCSDAAKRMDLSRMWARSRRSSDAEVAR
jgi:hypothetical protein